MDSLGRFMAILTAIVLIMLLPLQYMAQMHDINIESYAKSQTSEFAHKIRHERKITKADYEKYINSINKKGMYYDIEIEISHPITGKDIAQVLESKILNTTNTNSLKTARLNHSTMSNDIKLFSGHTHTDDCYPGNLHVCDGINCEYEGEAVVLMISAESGNNKGIYYSKNAVNWTKVLDNYVSSITYGKDKFIAPNRSSNLLSETNKIYLSSDGINWTSEDPVFVKMTGASQISIREIVYAPYNNYFYALITFYDIDGRYRTGIAASVDGITWERIYTYSSDLSISDLYISSSWLYTNYYRDQHDQGYYEHSIGNPNIIRSSEREVDIIHTGKPVLRYSQDKVYIQSNTSYNNIADIHYANGIEVKFDEIFNPRRTRLWVNGVRRTDHNIESLESKSLPGNMIYFGDRFMFTIPSEKNIYLSIDGLNWTVISSPVAGKIIACNSINGTGEIDRGPCLKIGKYYDENQNEVGPICHQVVTSITATHPNQTVKKGEPIITTALATYLDGHTDTVICTNNFNPEQLGIQNVTLTYTGLVGNAKTTGTITDNITVTVIPNKKLTSISVTPTAQSIPRYTNPIFTVRAHYDDGSSEIISPSKYSILGFNSAILGVQNVTISYTEEDITKTASATVEVTPMQITCPICGHIYELTPDNIDTGCPVCNEVLINISASPTYIIVEKGEELNITVTATYRSGRINIISDWTSDFNNEQLGTQEVTISYGGKTTKITVYVVFQRKVCDICGYEYDLEIDGSDSGCPICRSTIIGITTEPKEVTINKYDPIPITVTATFRDGHTEEITDWTSNLPIGEIGVFDVTIRYQDFYDNISVTVIDQGLIICPICDTQYYYRDSPRGCPVCSATVVGIEAYLKNGGTKVLKGSNLDLSVVLIYQDEHKEFLYEGYIITGYDPNLLGEQTVIITYNEFQTTLIIEVVESLQIVQCPNGHIYYLNPDGTDPGCPFCGAEEDSNLSEAIFYIDITYTDEILELLYENEVIYLEKGDYITIKITKNKKTYTNGIVTLFSKKDWYNKIFIYGGEVI